MNPLVIASATLIALYAALSINVSLTRIRKRKDPSSISDDELSRVVRAHGNASEYIPIFVAAFFYLSLGNTGYALVSLAVLTTLSRVAHAAGMLYSTGVGRRNPLRYYGAAGTYLSLIGVVLAIALQGQ